MTLLLTIFYIIPTIICWIYLISIWKDLDKNSGLEVAIFIIGFIATVIPFVNLIFAFVISVIFVLRNKNK